jgi:hypothetical protein
MTPLGIEEATFQLVFWNKSNMQFLLSEKVNEDLFLDKPLHVITAN